MRPFRTPIRGEVYFPSGVLPPHQSMPHRCVVLSSNSVIAQQGRNLFVNVALIRSAVQQSGKPVPLIPGHSFPVRQVDLPFLTNDSIIETHQIFAVAIQEFQGRNAEGRLQPPLLQRVLEGARRLFT